jgi:hypothetical protein
MAVYSGKFVDGKVVVDGDPPPDGTAATVHVDEEDDFKLTPEQLAELEVAIAQADRGEGIPAAVVLDELDAIVRGASST